MIDDSRQNTDLVREYIASDVRIRLALREHLSGQNDGLVVEEMCVPLQRARIDVAVIGDGLHGFEIKSDGDSLYRLRRQAACFGEVLDRATLVVGYRLAAKAMRIIPDWWGVLLASVDDGTLHLNMLRETRLNPDQDTSTLVGLLWVDELREGLKSLSIRYPARSSRTQLRTLLTNSAPDSAWLKRTVYRSLQLRSEWRTGALPA